MRLILAALLGGLLAWASLALGRVDGTLGAPNGADRLVAASDPVAAPQAAATNARLALRDRPLDGHAYRLLAQTAHAAGDGEQALELYRIAAERWPRERLAQAMLAEQAFAAGEWDTGFEHLDALLRVAPASRQALLAAILPWVGQAPVHEALLARLALDPPWRPALPVALLAEGVPAEGAESLLAGLATTLPPSEREAQARATLLQRLGRADAARIAWLDLLPEAERVLGTGAGSHVFDGGFEVGALRGVYDWQATVPPGVSAGVTTGNVHDGQQALSLGFSGRAVQFAHLRQQLALAPGEYRLESWSDDQVHAARPFAWRLGCVGEGGRLLDLPLSQEKGWQQAEAHFIVPEGCPTQALVLRHTGRNLAERRLRGTLWLDGIRVDLKQKRGKEALPQPSSQQ